MNGLVVFLKKLSLKCFFNMLVSFSIDPLALKCDSLDLSMSIAFHRRVIQEWRKHGILVHSHKSLKDSLIFQTIDKLPQECRKLWKTAMITTRKRSTLTSWDGTFPEKHLSEMTHLSKEFMIALLDPTRAELVCGLNEHESSRIENILFDMELCKFHSINESINFIHAQELAERSLSVGDNCKFEWNRRYSSHLKNANHVTIVDRYILSNHVRRISECDISGLTRLLNDCFTKPRDKQVSIKLICAIQSESRNSKLTDNDINTIDYFIDTLAKNYSGGGIRKIECYILFDSIFSKYAHERFFKVDYSVFGIDRGLDVYGGLTATRGSIVWRKDAIALPKLAEQEASLQTNAVRKFDVI